MRLIGALLLLLVPPVARAGVDPLRPHLDKAEKQAWVVFEDFVYPYLVTQTAALTDKKPAEAVAAIRALFAPSRLSLKEAKGKGLPESVTRESVPLPDYVTKGNQLQAIEECKREKCNMKLHDSSEAKLVEEASTRALKIQRYHDAVLGRIRGYLRYRELKGYESRLDNVGSFRKSLELLAFLKKRYPDVYGFLADGLWAAKSPPKSFRGSFLQQERLYLSADKMQPVWKVGDLLEFDERAGTIFCDVPVYTNHYFDSSVTLYEAIPLGQRTLLVMTDVMEIDELKKSAFIRVLYKGKMQEAVVAYQKERLNKLR